MPGYWDIHNHILPGVDDGSSGMDETYELLRMEYKQGIRNIIFTPHNRPKLFRVSTDDREEAFRMVCEQMKGEFPGMRFALGCEYFAREGMLEDLKDPRCRMAGTNVVLVEFSTRDHYIDIRRCVADLLDHGYQPLIAHAERYQCLYEMENRLTRLHRMGAKVQLNADSLLGKSGMGEKRFCIQALKNGRADFIASDAHNTDTRPVDLGACMKKLKRKFGEDMTERWFGQAQRELFGIRRKRRQG